jgi:cobalt/nickel transport system permease protein
MHIADGVLSVPVLVGTSTLAAAGVGFALSRMDHESIPRAGVLSAVFFVASLIHVPIGPSSAHLLLSGLLGFLLGWSALPALTVALLLQVVFFGFGGITALGANILIMGVPALLCHYLFARQLRPGMAPGRVLTLAFVAGASGVLFSGITAGIFLFASGREFVAVIWATLIGHILILVAEGFVTAFVVGFLHKVRPELLGGQTLVNA